MSLLYLQTKNDKQQHWEPRWHGRIFQHSKMLCICTIIKVKYKKHLLKKITVAVPKDSILDPIVLKNRVNALWYIWSKDLHRVLRIQILKEHAIKYSQRLTLTDFSVLSLETLKEVKSDYLLPRMANWIKTKAYGGHSVSQ